MILRQYSSNQPYLLASLPLVAGAMLLPQLSGAVEMPIKSGFPLDGALSVLYLSKYFLVFVTWLLVTAGAALSNFTFNRNEFHTAPTFLPGLIYAVVASSLSLVQLSVPALAANLAVLVGVNVLLPVYRQPRALAEYFSAGFWFGLAALAFPPYFSLIAALTVSIIITRAFNWREHLLSILGFGSPFLYWVCWKFWWNDMGNLILFHSTVTYDDVPLIGAEVWVQRVFLSLIVITFILALTRYLFVSDRVNNKVRIMKMVFFVVALALLSSHAVSVQLCTQWLVAPIVIPVTFLGGYWYTNYRYSLIAPFMFYALVVCALLVTFNHYHFFL
jgi:hypothetical protein